LEHGHGEVEHFGTITHDDACGQMGIRFTKKIAREESQEVDDVAIGLVHGKCTENRVVGNCVDDLATSQQLHAGYFDDRVHTMIQNGEWSSRQEYHPCIVERLGVVLGKRQHVAGQHAHEIAGNGVAVAECYPPSACGPQRVEKLCIVHRYPPVSKSE
jgi:hypothetical protein